jgi:tRNA-dihydrouridine synthase 2
MLQSDVSGIDLNCGCPKLFSIKGGMGAALLRTPDLSISILNALVTNCSVPITCKIRLLDPTESETHIERTLDLLKRLEGTGISAIAIHCRFTAQRPREAAHWDVFEQLASAIKIPIIANGDLWDMKDVQKFKDGPGKRKEQYLSF